jgi:quinoprotein glucose dehydrogenase
MDVTSRVVSRTLAAILAFGLAAAVSQRGHAQTGVRTWMDYGGDPANSRHMALNQINKSNLDQLSVAWRYPTHDTISYVFNPVVADDVMYVLARNNSLVAIDATTGKEIWIRRARGTPRAINYWKARTTDRRHC